MKRYYLLATKITTDVNTLGSLINAPLAYLLVFSKNATKQKHKKHENANKWISDFLP